MNDPPSYEIAFSLIFSISTQVLLRLLLLHNLAFSWGENIWRKNLNTRDFRKENDIDFLTEYKSWDTFSLREKLGEKNSPSGNWTPVSRVTGGDTYHYTNEDWWNVKKEII